jgi:membrane protein implicated in regulation of membrane protease activity
MLETYLFCLALGGVMLGASMVMGGDADADADVDVDGGLDFDADVDVDAGLDVDHGLDAEYAADGADTGTSGAAVEGFNWLLFLKVRFWLFALTFFGLTGTLLTLLAVFDREALTLSLAIPMGILAGYVATWVYDHLRRSETGTVHSERSILGSRGRVVLPVAPGRRGTVHLRIQGQGVDMTAITRGEVELATGTEVIVSEVEDAVVVIEPLPSP